MTMDRSSRLEAERHGDINVGAFCVHVVVNVKLNLAKDVSCTRRNTEPCERVCGGDCRWLTNTYSRRQDRVHYGSHSKYIIIVVTLCLERGCITRDISVLHQRCISGNITPALRQP